MSISGGGHGTRPDTQGHPVMTRKRGADSNPPNRAKPRWGRQGLQLPRTPEPRMQLPGARAQPVGFGDGRCTFRITSPTYPGPGQRRPNADLFAFGLPTPAHLSVGAQSGFNRFKDGLPNMTGSELQSRLPGRDEGSDPTRGPRPS